MIWGSRAAGEHHRPEELERSPGRRRGAILVSVGHSLDPCPKGCCADDRSSAGTEAFKRAVIIRERASFFLSFRHSVSQRPSSAVEDARSSAAHSFQRTRSIPLILWAGIPCQLILASRLYFRPGLLAI
ncbi:hypothetical protein NDU88_002702 [Pleurodeles waltl]|uniref:Uncharacterized protein n=1 Tax=Pleurodeles waltl TaxID=8319 RepID=A0AAV7WLX8_PLEWA|nr:hypothetical protein NDU88_002702 [Pleurodeles waltl]